MTRLKLSAWALLGGVLSLFTGAPDAIDPRREKSRGATATPANGVAEPSGFGVEGDGFYLWYEDRREAEEWAVELAGPAFPKQSS